MSSRHQNRQDGLVSAQAQGSNASNEAIQQHSSIEPLYFYPKMRSGFSQTVYVGEKYSTPLVNWVELKKNQANFQLEASFDDVPTGHYNIVWMIRKLPESDIQGAFHIRFIVEYEKENIVHYKYKHKKDSIIKLLDGTTDWKSLISSELIPVHPHIGRANIKIVLNRSHKVHGFGIQFESVKLSRAKEASSESSYPPLNINSCASNDECNVGDRFAVCASNDPSFETISRLEFSRDAHYLAALVMLKDAIRIQVWNTHTIQDLASRDISSSNATVNIPLNESHDVTVGIAISPSGHQIAVFQEPIIGSWRPDDTAGDASVPFCVFHNPLVSKIDLTGESRQSVVLDMDKRPSTTTNDHATPLELVNINVDYSFLQNMIGYGQFVGQEDQDPASSPASSQQQSLQSYSSVASFTRRNRCTLKPTSSKQSRFVSCNGYYVDIFDSTTSKWDHLQTIHINHMSPLHSRRFTCEIMMNLIVSGKLIWFENGNRCCSVWNIMSGANVCHIDTTAVKLNIVRDNKTLAVCTQYGYLAVAGTDGSISTYMIDSGVRIDMRKFPMSTIEYIGFHGIEKNELFVFVRGTTHSETKWLILDPLNLSAERATTTIPTLAGDDAVMTFINAEKSKDGIFACRPKGRHVEFFRVSKSFPPSGQVKEDLFKLFDKDGYDYELRMVTFTLMNVTGTSEARRAQGINICRTKSGLSNSACERVFAMVPEPWVWLDLEYDAFKKPKLLSAYFMPCGQRFIIVGSFTVQIWNLPTKKEPKCTLSFFWSQPLASPTHPIKGVQDLYLQIQSGKLDQDTGSCIYVDFDFEQEKVLKVDVPVSGTATGSRQLKNCIQSIYLLAATYLFASTGGKPEALDMLSSEEAGEEIIDFDDQAAAIRQFVQAHINGIIPEEELEYHSESSGGDGSDKPTRKISSLGYRLNTSKIIHHMVHPHHSSQYSLHHPSRHPSQHPSHHMPAPDPDQASEIILPTNPPSRLVNGCGDSSSRPKMTSILMQLVDRERFFLANACFMMALLGTSECNWIPSRDIMLNPLFKTAAAGNKTMTQTLIDYCVYMTRKHHPFYMLPVVQSVDDLSVAFPDMLREAFAKVSYVPAPSYAHSKSRIRLIRQRWSRLLSPVETFLSWLYILPPKRATTQEFRPFYHLQPCIEARRISHGVSRAKKSDHDAECSKRSSGSGSSISDSFIDHELRSKVVADFGSGLSEHSMIATIHNSQVFVAPFPGFSTSANSTRSGRFRTYFSCLAGRNFFDSPAMRATLGFKWYRFAYLYWLLVYLYQLVFFMIFIIVTVRQINVAVKTETLEDVRDWYLNGPWQKLIVTDMVIGVPLLLIEGYQCYKVGWQSYTSSVLNTFGYLSVTFVFICNIIFLETSNRDPEEDGWRGPNQVWFVSFTLFIMYSQQFLELRVIRPIGIFVNTLIEIFKRTMMFFFLYTTIMIVSTHMILYKTHTHQLPCAPGSEGCDLEAGVTQYPSGVIAAVVSTFFLVVGRWDALDEDLNNPNDIPFLVLALVFLVTTVLFGLNFLIAIMNTAYEQCKHEGEVTWLIQWSTVLNEITETFLTSWQKQIYMPDYIYYEATNKDVAEYLEKYGITDTDRGDAIKNTLDGMDYTFVATVPDEQSLTSPPLSPIFRRQRPKHRSSGAGSIIASPTSTMPSIYGSDVLPVAANAEARPHVTSGDQGSTTIVKCRTRFKELQEAYFEILEAPDDRHGRDSGRMNYEGNQDRLHAELRWLLGSAHALNNDLRHILLVAQVPIGESGRRVSESTMYFEAPTSRATTSTVASGVEQPLSSSPVSGTLTLTSSPVTSNREIGLGYFETSRSNGPLTLSMVRLRSLYYTSLELEKRIRQEISSL